ncbi:MAG: MFS transporter [Chloroflexi bacterium]|nr:MFS transporter [Chloroflexota bacterium]
MSRKAAIQIREAPSKASPYRWVVLAAFCAVDLATMLSSQSMGVMLPAMKVDLSLSPFQMGLLGASSWMGTFLFAILFGAGLSRYSPKKVTFFTAISGSILAFFQGMAQSFLGLFIPRFGAVVASVGRMSARTIIIQQWFPLHQVVLATGINSATSGIALAIATGLTPFLLIALGGWRSTFYLYSLLLLVMSGVWLVVGRQRVTPSFQQGLTSQQDSPLRIIWRHKMLWLLGLGSMGCNLGWGARMVFWPTYMLEAYRMPVTISGLMWSVHEVGYILGSVGAGWIANRVKVRNPLIWLPGFFILLFALGMLSTGNVLLLALFTFSGGFSWFFNPIIHSMPYELPGAKPQEVAVAVAFLRTMTTFGSTIGPILAGLLYQTTGSLYWALVITSLSPILTVIAGLIMPEREPRQREGMGHL